MRDFKSRMELDYRTLPAGAMRRSCDFCAFLWPFPLFLRLPHQNERSPVVGVWKGGLYIKYRFLKGAGFGNAALKALVKAAHQLSRGTVVNSPETDEQRWCSGIKETARQSEQFVTFPDGTHSSFASAQHGEFGPELEIENVKEVKPAVS